MASLLVSASAYASPVHHHHWTPLAEREVANRDHRNIDAGDRVFRTLRLEAVAGTPVITGIEMQYADGTDKFVRLNRPYDLLRHPRDLELNRGLRRINRIVVYTDPQLPGRFAVYGT
jgi:hypothetical protein